MNTPTFRILKHEALTISKSAQSAFNYWSNGDYYSALADLDQIVSDSEALHKQAVQMRDDVLGGLKPVAP